MKRESKRFTADPGSISHGTMREEDLIPRFVATLDALKEEESLSKFPNVARYARIDDVLMGIEQQRLKLTWGAYFVSEDASYDLEVLFDLLNEYAPDGYYFGSHPGDGADYGFWQSEEEDNPSLRSTSGG